MRPGWLLAANSMVFIGGLAFVAGTLAGAFAHWDPCVWMAAVIFLVPVAALACWQYAATFRARPRAANIMRLVLPVLAILFGLLALVTVGEALTRGYLAWGLAAFVAPLVLVAGWLVWLAWLTGAWHRRLWDAATAAGVDSRGPWRISLRELMGLAALVSLALAGFATVREVPPQSAMHVSAAESGLPLPAGASDVCVQHGFRGTIYYHFQIDEAGFFEWAAERGTFESDADRVPIKPIGPGGFTIQTCSDNPATGPLVEHTITRGWYYDWRKEDRGIHYGYDADQGRAYYRAHFH
jgi:hypothetical protein